MSDRKQGRAAGIVPDSVCRVVGATCLALAACSPALSAGDEREPAAAGVAPAAPAFAAVDAGKYAFDTGVLQGKLHVEDKMLGLTDVVHRPTGRSLAGRWGLMHLYRIFSGSRRFGNAARDWETTSRLLDDGAVEVRWPPQPENPFELRVLYRWHNATALDAIVGVRAVEDLPAFEIFLGSYFDAGLADPFVYVEDRSETGRVSKFLLGDQALGHWQMAPRDAAAVALIRDGRWQAGPSPVDWTILPPLAGPVALRRDRHSKLVAVIMAPKADCFAVAMPYAGETHYSLYLSLFGHDVAAGAQAQARVRLMIGDGLSDAEIADHYRQYERELTRLTAPTAGCSTDSDRLEEQR